MIIRMIAQKLDDFIVVIIWMKDERGGRNKVTSSIKFLIIIE
jgi:hypothetical protein